MEVILFNYATFILNMQQLIFAKDCNQGHMYQTTTPAAYTWNLKIEMKDGYLVP